MHLPSTSRALFKEPFWSRPSSLLTSMSKPRLHWAACSPAWPATDRSRRSSTINGLKLARDLAVERPPGLYVQPPLCMRHLFGARSQRGGRVHEAKGSEHSITRAREDNVASTAVEASILAGKGSRVCVFIDVLCTGLLFAAFFSIFPGARSCERYCSSRCERF